ncbi:hypothetical protein FN846DRAFT_887358 [Sphaerosporella brunnea]|uniref:Uncharacterized protein n=1 Tax=Sphaerosporella brunnea TaxID=1250544 RepID=A0A5J5F6F2_9PEZI|nr:hypothetical protein FN846DRAFT_887358 [Sphaerosporella brunnea]
MLPKSSTESMVPLTGDLALPRLVAHHTCFDCLWHSPHPVIPLARQQGHYRRHPQPALHFRPITPRIVQLKRETQVQAGLRRAARIAAMEVTDYNHDQLWALPVIGARDPSITKNARASSGQMRSTAAIHSTTVPGHRGYGVLPRTIHTAKILPVSDHCKPQKRNRNRGTEFNATISTPPVGRLFGPRKPRSHWRSTRVRF